MPFNGSGTYAAPALPGSFNPATTGGSATPADWNTLLMDISTALSTCITKDGQTTVSADIPMATHKITGLGNGTAAQDAVALSQITSGANGWALIQSQSVSAVSVLDFTGISTSINNIQCYFDLVPSGSTGQMFLQVYGTGGVLDTTVFYYSLIVTASGGALGIISSNTVINLSSTTVDGGGSVSFSGDLRASNIQGTHDTTFNFNSAYQSSATARIDTGTGTHTVAANITGIRIGITAGTFTGRASLYGAV